MLELQVFFFFLGGGGWGGWLSTTMVSWLFWDYFLPLGVIS